MSKVGTVSLMLALAFVLIIILLIFVASATEDQYILGEKIKIEIGEIGNYTLEIKTPTGPLFYKSDKPYFIFQPDTSGDFAINIKSESTSKQIMFEVQPDFETTTEENTALVPLEKINHTPPSPQQSEVIDINSTQTQIKVGLPVKWEKEITSGENIQIKIPESSSNITILSSNISLDFKIKTSLTDTISNLISEDPQKTIAISRAPQDTVLSYETPSPIKKEKIISSDRKEVEISAELHYENVLVSTSLQEELNQSKESSIKVYWKEEGKFLPFQALDTNNNSLLDTIEWTVPHLSTQTFEIIIITKAEHLDENKNFIEDIFEKVKALDKIFHLIPENNFLRIVFEKELTNKNDITIYAESNSTNATVEVYEKDSDIKLADFGPIQENKKYQILLTNLSSPQDTFDLLVVGGAILFDYIVDPSIPSVFSEGFETAFAQWGTVGGWDIVSDRTHSGSQAVRAANNNEGDLQSVNIDASQASSINATFWYNEDDLEDTDIDVYFYDGTTYDLIDSFGADQATEDTWYYKEYITTDSQYFISSFRIGFNANLANGENIWLDDINVNILLNTTPTTSSIILNSSLNTNMTTENLTCNPTSADIDGDTIYQTYNWIKNGSDYATLNLPFNMGSTSSSTPNYATTYTVSSTASYQSTGSHDSTGYYNFNGSTSLTISQDMSAIFGDTGTVMFWIRTTQPGSDTIWQAPTIFGTEAAGNGNDIFWGHLSAAGRIGISAGNGAQAYSTNPINNNAWHHVAMTRNSTTGLVQMYVDGNFNSQANSETGLKTTAFNEIGVLEAATRVYFNGSLDNFLAFPFVMSAEQIAVLYNQNYNTIVSQETTTGEVWSCEATPNDGALEGTTSTSNSLTILSANLPPSLEAQINSTTGTNYTTSDLNCFATLTDPESNLMNVTAIWYRNAGIYSTTSYNNSYSSGTEFLVSLSSSNTTDGEVWSCRLIVTDGEKTTESQSGNLTIIPLPLSYGMYLRFNDTFTGANGNLFTTHTPDEGVVWSQIYNDASFLQITSNQLDASNGNNDGAVGIGVISNTWNPDQMVTATYAVQDNLDDLSHLIVRSDATMSNAYIFSFSTTAANTRIWKRVGSTNTVLETNCGGDNQFTTGDIVTLRITGTSIEVYDGSTLICSTTDSDLDSGSPGVGIGSSYLETAGNVDAQRLDNVLMYSANSAPTDPSPLMYSLDGPNDDVTDYNCTALVEDIDADQVTAYVIWYKNDSQDSNTSQNNVASTTNFSVTLSGSRTAAGEVWKCSARYYDGKNYSNWVNSTGITILPYSAPPSISITRIFPIGDNIFVEQNQLFNVTLNVTCLAGNCGTINVTLDPIQETYSDFETGTEGFEHFPLNAKVDEWHISTEYTNNGSQSWKVGDTGTGDYADYSESILVSPTYDIIANSTFDFYHYMDAEVYGAGNGAYDGGYLQYQLDGGSWQKVTSFISGGYNTIYRVYSGGPPLTAGEPVWGDGLVGTSSNFSHVVINMTNITSGSSAENVSFRFHWFSDESVNEEGWYIDSVNFTTQTPNMDKGIIPVNAGTPFYTTAASNPLTTSSLSEGQSQLITFLVNATGELARKYFFFAYANMTTNLSTSNITSKWNVTISVEQELPNITINYPTPGEINDATPILNISLTGEGDTLWYNINGGTNQTLCSACSFSNDEILYLREANYTLNVFVRNPMGEENSESVSFNVDMRNNYYDTYLDSSYELDSEELDLLEGNITLSLARETIINETFDNAENWLLSGGRWELSSGELIQTLDSADTLAIYDTLILNNITDYNISFSMYAADNDQSGVVFAYEDPQNYYRCRLYQQTSQGGIERVSGGSSTSLASASTMYTLSAWNTFVLEIKNKTVSCYINGVQTATASNVSFPEGKVGIFNTNNLNVRYDNFSTIITGGKKIGTFTSYSVKLINEITKFTNITWNSFSTNVNNILRVEVTVDNGNTWYEATKDSSLTIPSGEDFAYRLFFEAQNISIMSLLDLNISWTNGIDPPPTILIEGITLPTEQDFTPMLNVTLIGDAAALIMSINGRANQTICTDCTGSQIFPVVLNESTQTIRFYANNTMGQLSTNSTTFNVDFGKHYFDEFLDNSSIRISNNVTWNYGNITMTGGTGNVTSHTMNTSQEITRISHASWTESGVDATNTISLQLTVDNGNNWYTVANGGSLSGFAAGSNLIYRFLYSTDGPNTITAHDLNITWESPPTIEIHYPQTYVYNSQIVKMNYSISYASGVTLVACWYSLNGGTTNTSITCGDDITGITSVDGENTWTVYAQDSAGSQGQKSITFSVDTTAPAVTLINQTNEAGQIVNSSHLLLEGENLTLNMDVDDLRTDSVWVVIWEGVIGGVEKTRVVLENIFGNWWSAEIETDETFGESYNYTVYANDTAGLIGSYNGTFQVLKATLDLIINPNPSPGAEIIFMTGSLEFSNGTAIPNNAINFWWNNVLIPFANLTNQGTSASVLDFDEDNIKIISSYDNVTYSGGEFTLDSLNTTGSFTGILDAGARVNWENVSWTDVAQSCSGTVDFQNGNSWGYSSTKDSYITSGNPTVNFATSEELTIDSSPDVEKSIVEFEEAFGFGANKVPYGATVSAATLRLTLFDSGDNPTFYEILEAWDESEVTSIYRTASDLWSSESIAGSPSRGTVSIGTMSTATTGTKSLDISSTTSKWALRNISNNGLVIEASGSGGIKFRSSQYSTASERPRLTVDFTATDCNGVLVYVRTSNDKSSWTGWTELSKGQGIVDSLNYSRYLEYRVEMGSFNSTFNPRVQALNFNYTGTFTDASGLFNYSFISTDVFGSYTVKATSGYKTIITEDSDTLSIQSGVPPEVSLLSPANRTWFNQSSVNLTYNASDVNGDFKSSALTLNGVFNLSNQTAIIEGANNFTVNGLTSGTYYWSVNLSDIATTDTSETRIFYIDLISPVVNLISPKDTANFTSGFLNLSFNASDNMDSNLSCNVSLDGTVIQSNIPVSNNTAVNVSSGPLSGGTHLWEATCIDEAKNTFTTPMWSFDITDLPPTLSLIDPADNHLNSTGNIEFIYLPDDNSGMNRCELLINGQINSTNSSINLGVNNMFNITGIPDGIYNWTVQCFDLSNTSVMPANRTLLIDLFPPAITLISPANETSSSSSEINFEFNVTDSIDSELDCSLFIDSVSESNFQSTSGVISSELFSGLPDGLRTWRIDCTDNSSHTSSSPTWTLNISESPRVYMNSTNGTYIKGNAILAEFTPTDNTQITSCAFYLDGVINTTQIGGISIGALNSLEAEGVSDGRHTYYIECTDGIGLSNVSEENEIFLDNSLPLITPHFPLNEEVYASNVSFEFEVFDPLSPTLKCNLTIDSNIRDTNFNVSNSTNITRTIPGITDGVHYWNLTCSDLAGNLNTSTTYNFTKSTVPGINLVSPLNNTWMDTGSFNFTYLPQDDEGFQKSELIINGAVSMENQSEIISGVNNNFTVNLADGIYLWSVNITDATGLVGESETRKVYIDTAVPTIQLGLPSQGQIYNDNNVTFNFTITDNLDSQISCDLYLDTDLEWSGNTTNATQEITNLLIVDGNHTYRINCSDEAGNQATSTPTNFTVFAPPRINLVSPANRTYTQEPSINFSYTPLDALGLMNCSIYLDGTRNQSSSSIIKNVQNNFIISGISEGVHNWSVGCADSDENLNMSETRIFYRDITPPTINLTSPENNAGINANSNVIFIWTTTDALDTLLSCDLVVDGNIEDTSFATSGFPRTEPVSGLSIGTHFWNVTCTDTSGNTNTSETRSFNYTYPDFLINGTSISISNDNPTENETITINATVYNIGGADILSVQVKFYSGDPEGTGTQIGTTKTILINKFSLNTTSIQWNAPLGETNVFAVVDFPNTITELNETNNKANSSISVQSWHFFYGNINAGTNFTLTDSSNYELTNWNLANLTKVNIYVADYDSNINWLSLQAIGKKISGTASSNDIQELDTALSMTSFRDSHAEIYLNSSLEINETLDYTVFAKTITAVPVATSINSTNFKTGILWDTSDDANTEYDSTEKEDIIYITKISKNQPGSYENADYELRVPANLRSYDPTNQQTAVFYLEII